MKRQSGERSQTAADELRIREAGRFPQASELSVRLRIEPGVDEDVHVLQSSLCHTGLDVATTDGLLRRSEGATAVSSLVAGRVR
jgi:hypothetical protein